MRTDVGGDFNIHVTKFFYNAVFRQKSNKYDVVSLPVPLVSQKTCPPREILTRLIIIETTHISLRDRIFGQPKKGTGGLKLNNFFIFDGKQHPKNIWFCGF